MKSFVILLNLFLFSLLSHAQKYAPLNEPDYNKKRAFTDVPQKAKLRLMDAEKLLNLPVGATVNAFVADGFRVSGTVVSTSDASDAAVRSVVVRLNNRQGATFTFTKRKKEDGSFTYTGRVFSKASGDALAITKENGQYLLMKKAAHDLFVE